MTTKSHFWKPVAVLSAAFALVSSASAATVYNNSTTYLGKYYTVGNGVQVGDQVNLAGTDRVVTDFRVQYFVSDSLEGTEQATVWFYQMDGPGNTQPGTILYQSNPFNLDPGSGFFTIDVSSLSVTVPNSFTWAVSFSGLEAAEQPGLLFYNPPTIGSSLDDFWLNAGAGWQTMVSTDGTVDNFAAVVVAVPEPSTYLYAILGGLTLLGFRRFRR